MTDPVPEPTGETARPPKEPSIAATALAVFGVGLAIFLLAGLAGDVAYWFASRTAVDLGRPGEYHPERLAQDAFARIEGSAGRHAARFERFDLSSFGKRRWEIVAVIGSDVALRRASTSQDPSPKREPPPDPAPFVAEGRLVRDDQVPEVRDAFRLLAERGELAPKEHAWLLFEGERPRQGWFALVAAVVLVLFLLANVAALVRAHVRPSRVPMDA